MLKKYALYRLLAAVIVAEFAASPGRVQAQAAPPEKPERGIDSPQTCSGDLSTVPPSYRENLKAWESRVPAAAADLAQTQKELDNLQVAVATAKPPWFWKNSRCSRCRNFWTHMPAVKQGSRGNFKDLYREIDELKKSQQEQVESQNALRVQLNYNPGQGSRRGDPELQQAFLTYLNLAGDRNRLQTRVLDLLDQRRRLLEQEQELLAGLTPQLKQLEADWKGQLLRRPAAVVPFREQVAQAWKSLAVIPQRGWDWLNGWRPLDA